MAKERKPTQRDRIAALERENAELRGELAATAKMNELLMTFLRMQTPLVFPQPLPAPAPLPTLPYDPYGPIWIIPQESPLSPIDPGIHFRAPAASNAIVVDKPWIFEKLIDPTAQYGNPSAAFGHH